MDLKFKIGNTSQINNTEIDKGSFLVDKEKGQILIDTDEKKRIAISGGVGESIENGGEIFNDYENNQANALCSHAEGQGTKATGPFSHSEGRITTASAFASHSEGYNTSAEGEHSHAEGVRTEAKATGAHSEGADTIAEGKRSHTEGNVTYAKGFASHAEGGGDSTVDAANKQTNFGAFGDFSHSEGVKTKAEGKAAHSEGANTKAVGTASHAEGSETLADGTYSHVEGKQAIAQGAISHAEGANTIAVERAAHAEGDNTKAEGQAAHSEGANTRANGYAAHAEGEQTTAKGRGAHAEGFNTEAKYDSAHAEGKATHAYGIGAHSEGFGSVAEDRGAHAEGIGTIAHIEASHAQGKYNKITKDTLTNVSLDGVIRAEATNYIFKTDGGIEWSLNTDSGANHYCFSYPKFSVGEEYKLRLTLNASKAAATTLNFYAWEDLNAVADATQTVRNRVDLAVNKSIFLGEGENIINVVVTLKTYPYLAMRFYNNSPIYAEITLTKLEIVDEKIDYTIISSIGNGFDEDNRSNAFTVYKDGHAEVGKMGETNLSVATKEYVDNKPVVNIANALKGSASGNIVVLKDVSPLPHDVKIKVNDADESNTLSIKTQGKNLLPYPYIDTEKSPKVMNGITFIDNGDGSITVKGTAEADANFILSYNNKFGDKTINAINGDNATNGEYAMNKRLFYSSTNAYLPVSINIPKGVTVDETLYPQIELGTVSTEYEPYVEPKTYTANADGTLTVPSIYPTMMISAESNAKNLLTGNVLSKPSNWFDSSDGISSSDFDEVYLSSKNQYQPLILQGSYLEAGKEYVFGVDVIGFTLNSKSPEIYNSYVVCLQYIDTNGVKYESNKIKLDARGRRQLTFKPTKSGVYNLICFGRDNTSGSVSFTNPQVKIVPQIICEYNRDINKAFAELYQAIISLGGNL